MAYDNPNDPYKANLTDAEISRQARIDGELQADPEFPERPASGSKVAMFAVAVAVVLGAVFYGLNNTSMNPAGTGPTTAQNTQSSPPVAPPGMRDVTPRSNTEPGVTTGAAPSRLQQPAAAPNGSDINKSTTPAPDNAPVAPAPVAK